MDDYHLVSNLMGRYCQVMDARDFGRLDEVFTDDGLFVMANGAEMRGLVTMATTLTVLLQYRPPADLHVANNVIIELEGDEGTASSDWQYLAPTGDGPAWAVIGVGRYEDRVRRTAAGWRLAERRIVPSAAGMFTGR